MPSPSLIDPRIGPKLALGGRVVTMDVGSRVVTDGVVYLDHGDVAAVLPRNAAAPAGFEGVAAVDTGGTIFPGLIDLHDHMAYNALALWDVPKRYARREQWGGIEEYGRLVTGPMKVLGRTEFLPAVVRYVEVKCLLGGVTSTQGIELFSNKGARRYYRGLVRNVEAAGDPDLPNAAARIGDYEASNAQALVARLAQHRCYLLHLAEGAPGDAKAREHFTALRVSADTWALASSLAGIHSAALTAADFDVLARYGCSMVWSPLSNLLLYGQTADVTAAHGAGIRIALGPDWSVSGSKNLLGELKVARLWSHHAGGDLFGDRDVVAMATRVAAAILHWDAFLGSLDTGKRADLIVVRGIAGDPYAAILQASETDVVLVMINGTPRVGTPALMTALGASGEAITVGGERRTLNLRQQSADPDVQRISFADARATLRDTLKRLPAIAKRKPKKRAPTRGLDDLLAPPEWSLALDEIEDTGLDLRPRVPPADSLARSGPSRAPTSAVVKGATTLVPLALDPPSVADDADFLDRIAAERNLPPWVAPGLRELYG